MQTMLLLSHRTSKHLPDPAHSHRKKPFRWCVWEPRWSGRRSPPTPLLPGRCAPCSWCPRQCRSTSAVGEGDVRDADVHSSVAVECDGGVSPGVWWCPIQTSEVSNPSAAPRVCTGSPRRTYKIKAFRKKVVSNETASFLELGEHMFGSVVLIFNVKWMHKRVNILDECHIRSMR